jgi:hypothetical protein
MALPSRLAQYNALIDFVVNLLLGELTEKNEPDGRSAAPPAAGNPSDTNPEDGTPALIATTELLDQ